MHTKRGEELKIPFTDPNRELYIEDDAPVSGHASLARLKSGNLHIPYATAKLR